MKTSLRRILCLALGLATAATAATPVVFGQDLEFRPVPRPVSPPPVSAPAPTTDAVSLGVIVPASFMTKVTVVDGTLTSVDDPTKIPPAPPIAPAPALAPAPAVAPGSGVPRQMPIAGTSDAPTLNMPQMVAPGPGMIVTQPTIVSQPTIVGQPMIITPGSTSYMAAGDCGTCGSCGSCGSCCDTCGMAMFRQPQPHPIWDHLFGGCGAGTTGCGDPCGCTSCGDPCGCACCGPRSSFWVRGEFMIDAMTRQNAPPLVTQGATFAQLPLGAGGTVLFDRDNLPHDPFDGGRINIGFWFPNHSEFGLDFTAFFLSQRNVNFGASSDGTFALGRPYLETSTAPGAPTNTPQAEVTGAPGFGSGSININASTRAWGFDPDLRAKLLCGPTWWVDGLAGYRFFRLEDQINITENITPLPALGNASNIVVQDSFATRNTFNGGEIGLDGEWHFFTRWSLGGTFKLAIGDLNEQIRINGGTTATFPGGAVQSFPAGFFALASNIGTFSQNRFSVLPEFGLRINYDITDHLRIYAGYNAMFLSNVVRAGDQIDTRINSSQAPPPGVVSGPLLPAVLFKRSDFWAQGVSMGLEYHY